MFLSARDLLQLALVCRRFGQRWSTVPTTSIEHGGSLVYEAARLQLLRRPRARRAMLTPMRTGSGVACCWLARLQTMERLEAPLEFTRVGPRVWIQENGVVVSRSGVTCHSGHRAAIVGGHHMLAGCHFARFTLMDGATSLVGFCPASFDPSSGNGCHMDHWMLHVSVYAGTLSKKLTCCKADSSVSVRCVRACSLRVDCLSRGDVRFQMSSAAGSDPAAALGPAWCLLNKAIQWAYCLTSSVVMSPCTSTASDWVHARSHLTGCGHSSRR